MNEQIIIFETDWMQGGDELINSYIKSNSNKLKNK